MKFLHLSPFFFVFIIGCNSFTNQQTNGAVVNKIDTSKGNVENKTISRPNKDSLKKQEYKNEEKDYNSDITFLDSITNYIYKTKKISSIQQKDVDNFVSLLIKRWGTNAAEWEEYSNGVLFDLLEYKTKEIMQSFSNVDSIKFNGCIVNEISTPVNEDTPVKKILSNLRSVSCNEKVKNKVIKALQEALYKKN